MRQVLHILRKDARRFYPEILISLAVSVLFLRYYRQVWAPPGREITRFGWLPNTCLVLMPVVWLILTTRVVHAESLVGDRQFWITRPYRWQALLGAKWMFIAVFTLLPYMLVQAILLRMAGFHPSQYIGGILYQAVMAALVLILPMMLMASITSNFGKMLLGLFLLVLYAAGTAWASDLMPASVDFGSGWLSILLLVGMAAILVGQYATRKTGRARWMVLALGVCVTLTALFRTGDAGIEEAYQQPGAQATAPVQVVVKTRNDSASYGPPMYDDKREIRIAIPLEISGIAPDTAVQVDYARIEVRGSHGQYYRSHWQQDFSRLLPGQSEATLSLRASRSFAEQVKKEEVTIDVSLAITVLKAGTPERRSVPQGTFKVQDGSLCSRVDEWRQLRCRSAMGEPPLMLMGTRFTQKECRGDRPANDGKDGLAWVGALREGLPEFTLTPVLMNSVFFSTFDNTETRVPSQFCVGSPLVIVPYKAAGRSQVKATTRGIGLEHFVMRMEM